MKFTACFKAAFIPIAGVGNEFQLLPFIPRMPSHL
jgi:hypothetical protein